MRERWAIEWRLSGRRLGNPDCLQVAVVLLFGRFLRGESDGRLVLFALSCPCLRPHSDSTWLHGRAKNMSDFNDRVLALILAGGMGSRLHPLTAHRAKPAVPFGGKYRIIDFTLSNCLHSKFRRILVLTQYKSHSLQKHLRDGWSVFNPTVGEYITPIPPQM